MENEINGKNMDENIEVDKTEQNNEDVQEHYESIYEIESKNDSMTQNGENQNYQFSFISSDKKLSFVGNDTDSIPTELIYQFGLKTLSLDVSFNFISDLRDLVQFPYLEELICDNNSVSEETNFPKLDNLKIFSCNKNKIENIHIFVDKIKISFPNLTYLSMLGNKACPNQLIDSSNDEYDYTKYRKYIIFRLKNLKFLDCYEVTKEEKEKISNEERFFDVVKVDEQKLIEKDDSNKNDISNRDNKSHSYSSLPSKNIETNDFNPQASFGVCKYIYYGKQSEGNRFIRNTDL